MAERNKYDVSDEQAEDMFKVAEEAMQRTYPRPNEGYSAAVLTSDGKIFPGASYGSDTHVLTIHGEASALAHAAVHGEPKIIAITGPNCHACKQMIWEKSVLTNTEIMVITKESDKLVYTPIIDLMPQPWPDAEGNH